MEANVSTDLRQQQIVESVKGLKSWLKFLGILSIIGGILYALTLVGIIFAWLPIWLGVILNQAGSKAAEYAERGDNSSLAALLEKLKTYFTITGILVIISFALGIMITILGLILGLLGAASIPDMLKQFGF